jgi:hypothetical protein
VRDSAATMTDVRDSVTTSSRPNPSPVPEGADPLLDLAYFGFIRSIDASTRTISFDVAQWLVGSAANAAAEEDGVIRPGEGMPNDYYVRNKSTVVRTLPVSADVVVTVLCAGGCGQAAGTFEGLAASFAPESNPNPNLGDTYRGPHSQYWVTVRSGSVVRLDEQYRP